MRRILVTTLLTAFLAPVPALAHPHVWVDTIVTAHMDKGAVTSLREDWTFDEDFSASVLGDVRHIKGMGGDRHSPLTPGEIVQLQQNAFSNLKHYDYFTHIWLNDKRLKIKPDVEGFTARLEGDKLRYWFTVQLAQPAAVAKGGVLKVGIWDDSYYVDVGPATGKPAAVLEGDGSAACRARIADDPKHLLYYGSITPKIVEVTC